jgi:hypothetical protein
MLRIEYLIICVVAIFLLFLLFGFILAMRYLSYREKVALAEKGFVPEEFSTKRKSRSFLISGLIFSIAGFMLTGGIWALGMLNHFDPYGLSPFILLGLAPLGFGLFLLLVHVIKM